MKSLRRFGPGFLVTAAFIGPGTITTASVSGSLFGTALLWAIVFSILATTILQEMSARLGLVTRSGLGEALRTTFANPVLRALTIAMVVAAITFGNGAFEMGNILGAAIGLELLTGVPRSMCALAVGTGAFLLLAIGTYAVIERFLIILVGLMGLVFLLTAIVVRPDAVSILAGMFQPSVPPGSMMKIMALIGTTVVPYNLFLHASSVQEKWSASLPLAQSLRSSRFDIVLSITVGGLMTIAVVVTAAAIRDRGGIDGAAAMAEQLEPLLGPAAKIFFAVGLAAAGLTSAVTAPLAAAYATAGALGFERNARSWKFRIVWGVILIAGTVLAMLGRHPVTAIVFAQAANGILLPILAVFLLIVMNRGELMREHKNGPIANSLGVVVVAVASGLGIFNLIRVLGRVTGDG